VPRIADDGTEDCSAKLVLLSTYRCELPGNQRYTSTPVRMRVTN
jgi:hypothetical protein